MWPLLEVVDAHLDEPWLAALGDHLRNAGPDGELRRFATVRHIADLYDRYGVHRPEMLRSWAADGDRGDHGRRALAGGSVAPACESGSEHSAARPNAWSMPAADCATTPHSPTFPTGCPCSA